MKDKIYPFFDTLLCLLSVLAIVLFSIGSFFDVSTETARLLDMYDYILCGLFFTEFCYTLARSTNKKKYFFTYGWLDLISSIPLIDSFRVGRFAKLIKMGRFLRIAKSTHVIVKSFTGNTKRNTLLLTITMGSIILCIASILILIVEDNSSGNIHTAQDALWWSFVTVTTVGYGDFYPVSGIGRIIAGILMFTGISMFGVLTASLASIFIKPENHHELTQIKIEMNEIKELLSAMKNSDSQNNENDDAA
jgi:voltage-gated potassium channel